MCRRRYKLQKDKQSSGPTGHPVKLRDRDGMSGTTGRDNYSLIFT